MKYDFDCVIVGSGIAGMTAAIYLKRANVNVCVIDYEAPGGLLNKLKTIENYPGFKSILGPDLAEKMYQGATQFGAEYAYGSVEKVEVNGDLKQVITDSETYEAPVVIIATGSQYRKLGVEGEAEYAGRGVSYCAVCDGAFFKDQPLAVIGGGDSAVEEGGYLAKLASNVNIIHRRDQLRAQKILQERAFANDKIDFTWDTVVTKINGDGQKVTSVSTHNKKTGEDGELKVNGVFIYVGVIPLSEPFKELGITDEQGWIKTDELMQTSLPGVYAIGDVRAKELRQITTAVGDGSIAGQQAFNYLESLKD